VTSSFGTGPGGSRSPFSPPAPRGNLDYEDESLAYEEERPVPRPEPAPRTRCPRCGGHPVQRRNGNNGNLFTGCSGFPACRYTVDGHDSVGLFPVRRPRLAGLPKDLHDLEGTDDSWYWEGEDRDW